MSKREANGSIGVAEGSRSKRFRRDADGGVTSDGGDAMSDNQHSDGEGSGGQNVVGMAMEPEEIKQHGLHIWQTVKDAVNKDGRVMSPIFMRKPLKRMYPDYYILIKQPIALDDIKSKIEKSAYPTLEDVRQDFELCFNNAKQYNQKESEVWRDAKDLLKIVNKTYAKIIPQEGDEKKSKPPSLSRLVKTRLQKLVDRTDENGRYLATEFMQLPSRKLWPIYYKEIKQPQCFENVFKKIKRKEYHSTADFAADVELVFSNAMTFNQEHTQIWEDALALRTQFRQLMSDLPPPYSLTQYPQISTKIKIKPHTAKAEPSQHSLTLRVPATTTSQKVAPAPLPVAPNKVIQPPKPVVAPTPAPAATAVRNSPRSHPVPLPPQPIVVPSPLGHSTTPQYLAPTNAPATAQINPSIPAASTPSILRTSSVQNSTPAGMPTPSPAPPSSQHQLKSVKLRVEPPGRIVYLHHTDGVKGWALRMLPGEVRVVISDVTFQPSHDDDEDESSDEEEEEEEDYDDDMAVDTTPMRNGRKKGKGRRRGRPTRSSARHTNNSKAPLKKKLSKPGEVQLKVNGLVVAAQADQPGDWDVHLPLGASVLEVGEVGGLIWKVYAERPGAA